MKLAVSLGGPCSEMTPALIDILPPELWDCILDCLYDDKPSLRQCSLAARNWRPRAQHHLFRSIYIDWSTCDAFTRLLESNPSLGAHVVNMEIEGAFGFFSLDRLHGITLDKWLRATPASFSHILGNLTKLDLALITIDVDLVRCVFGCLTTVTQLTLYACALTSFDAFTELFFSYPRMKCLNIAWIQEWETSQSQHTPVPQDVAIPELEVVVFTSTRDNLKVPRWLISQGLHRSIHTATFWRVEWQHFTPLSLLLAALAPTLRNLRVGWDHAVTPDDWSHPVMTPLPFLTSLTVDFHTGRAVTIPYTLFLLSRLSVPALHSLTFAITCKDAVTSQEVPWTRLAEASARIARAAPLKSVVVSAGVRDAADGVNPVFPGRQLPIEVYELMEARMVQAFVAQGLERMVSFVARPEV
ncbi:hypothetical protein L226DRAFT_508122 [Lentinus tigrinus ALCF2SS1-7]|uniref:F-box domain-containing protein n=1 Tax=Lentinus tigrinus ALCF2SS1-6 TaxID=1328759 RepID=A0A5C2SA28_9APHY|nr:hypothetical protein L227DRAFT_102951 [Lentinus tigrinus ALCF2SS1-6]RPD74697.1 hypothetical protein L226DRAFT_508122 [Lentinus tigrinus ALCF2SS1-7]